MNEFIMVKAKKGLRSLDYVEESYTTGESRYFNITGSDSDKDIVKNLTETPYPIYFLVFTELGATKTTETLYLGQGLKNDSQKGPSFKITIKQKIENKSIIQNFLSCSEIDLNQDFEHSSYISFEVSQSLVKQMNFITNPPYENAEVLHNTSFPPLTEEKMLHPLAQRNEYCIRDYTLTELHNNYGAFQKDYEHIVHSKSFRRMVDKAQIFSAEKGDHYRTRMTHSIAVAQISKRISNSLKLNCFLTDAIAFGHDIGHTPFGHQGERTLNTILTDKSSLLKATLDQGIDYGEFKHNYHSLRVATRLEEKYVEFDGLNLSFQTLDGIWKHTKTNLKNSALTDFASSEYLREYLEIQSSIPNTLEGQVVRVADEIAQRSHDLEDAFTAKRLSIEELKNYLQLKKMNDLKTEIENIENTLTKAQELNRFGADDNELLQESISSRILSFFINDVLEQSELNINNYLENDKELAFIEAGYVIKKNLIDFSAKGKKLCDYLEKIISKKVINSAEVSLFDSNGAAIVSALFASYYNNPRLLHKGTLHRIMQDFRNLTKNVIDFEEGDPRLIEAEWKKIICACANDDTDLEPNEYVEKNKILVRNIVDFIAGMTDSYAINEYNNIRR